MKTNTYVQNKHSQMVNTCNRTCLACSKIWMQGNCHKTVTYLWRSQFLFLLSPAWMWSEAGGAWTVIRTGSQLASVMLGERFLKPLAHIHGNKLPYVRTDNICHLSIASRKQTLWRHNTRECRSQRRQVSQESVCTRGKGECFTFSFQILFNNIKIKFSKINCLRFCCKLCIISSLISTHRK